ncbi:MAG: Serine-type D-Ala-D-Ala carboxypeptidase [Tardiphaga sp.]|nr:Serine-type D-Ala-D-Ala carboxypeptidase [Tardiphaga sp.]
MLRTNSASSRTLRACILGLATVSAVIIASTDTADARRRGRHHARSEARQSYSPAFASIIVDGNSGATLTSNNADALRHPASLTKIMTLYMLFEKLEQGKLKLDSEMEVSSHASSQSPTKLGLRPGSTLEVEDAIKALVTRSANDAAVVIAEAIAGDEDDFAKLMTRKARALGMTRTVYRNASGLPDDEQVTTARDQSVLGRAIQDRFPKYYRYFSTNVFVYRGRPIRNHNRLLGTVEGIDGIKTGYTRASGFNLVSSIRRGNRHLVGVVLGGRSGGSRDAIMRNLLAENIDKGASRRTVAAITERGTAEANADVAEETAITRPTQMTQRDGAIQVASTGPAEAGEPAIARQTGPTARSVMSAVAAQPAPQRAKPEFIRAETAKSEPMPFSSGVIQSQSIPAMPGSLEPMKPVRIKTVQVKSGQMKIASAAPSQPTPVTNAIPLTRSEAAETSNSVMSRAEMPPQPANHGTGRGILGTLPAGGPSQQTNTQQAMAAYAEPASRVAPKAMQDNGAIRPTSVSHSGWIIQVGALESEGEARQRLDAAKSQARGLLGKADPFTETVGKGDKKLYRARFAGLDKDQAEAACKTLKRSDISCITIRN